MSMSTLPPLFPHERSTRPLTLIEAPEMTRAEAEYWRIKQSCLGRQTAYSPPPDWSAIDISEFAGRWPLPGTLGELFTAVGAAPPSVLASDLRVLFNRDVRRNSRTVEKYRAEAQRLAAAGDAEALTIRRAAFLNEDHVQAHVAYLAMRWARKRKGVVDFSPWTLYRLVRLMNPTWMAEPGAEPIETAIRAVPPRLADENGAVLRAALSHLAEAIFGREAPQPHTRVARALFASMVARGREAQIARYAREIIGSDGPGPQQACPSARRSRATPGSAVRSERNRARRSVTGRGRAYANPARHAPSTASMPPTGHVAMDALERLPTAGAVERTATDERNVTACSEVTVGEPPNAAPTPAGDEPVTLLTDEEWAAVAPLLPRGAWGPARNDDRLVLSALAHRARHRTPFRSLSPIYGSPSTISSRLQTWQAAGVWDRVVEALPHLFT